MSNIEILEEFIEQYNASYPEEKEWVAIYPEQIQAIENLIQENKELKEENLELHKEINQRIKLKLENERCVDKDFIPKSKVKELAKKYEFALNGYDSSTADYKHSQNLGRYLACVELLEEGE